jgi:VIT1/CCC1 family predicted Fe2+/Mn2+ transporter
MRDTAPLTRGANHHTKSSGAWLRAAVLGANDGVLSTSSLMLGVAAAHGSQGSIVIAGVSGLVAGAMSMAAGEYVSVHSQADAQGADLALEQEELRTDIVGERAELAGIFVGRGLDPELAKQVALQLMARDALGAHALEELGISDGGRARPVQAALASAASFSTGALVPLIVSVFTPAFALMPAVAGTSLVFLALLGALAARVGGARMARAAMRVLFWGALAMGVTAAVGEAV